MYRLLLAIAAAVSVGVTAFAQKAKTVTAEYIYQIPDNVAPEAAKSTALERAKLQAIADEFGTTVTQSTSVSVTVDNTHTSSSFTSLGGSEVKGEWIETIGTPIFEFITKGTALAVKVKVKGKIRELLSERIPVKIRTFRNGLDDCNESSDFMAGDALYMSFSAPASGYLAVYLVDASDNVFCLLPYQGQTDGFYHTTANRRHWLFCKDHADETDKAIVDELILDTDRPTERNRLIAIFSPNKFFKAVDTKIQDDLPRSLTYPEFTDWLSNIKKKDVTLAVHENFINISK